MDPDQIKTHPELSSLFLKDPKIVTAIKDDMDKSGFNPAYPIVVGFGEWTNGDDVVVDGHTRLQVALDLGLTDVETVYQEFSSLLDAVEFAVRSQANRRNLSPGELYEIVAKVDRLKQRGGDRNPNSGKYEEKPKAPDGANGPNFKSASQTASILGTSPRTVERIRTISKSPDEDIKQAVKENKMSITKAENVVKERKKQDKIPKPDPTFNLTNNNIEWAKWTWNPVTGCEHGCKYCYARDIAMRFTGHFRPEFHHNRIYADLREIAYLA